MGKLPPELKAVIRKLEKKFGEGILKTGADESLQIKTIPSGIPPLDWATGRNGFPLGRHIELYGAEQSGKSTIALLIAANAQKQGYLCMYIDAEHAYDEVWAKKLGVDTEALIYTDMSQGEHTWEAVREFLKTKKIGVIILDSLASIVPTFEVDAGFEKIAVGRSAKLNAQAMRIITAENKNQETLMIYINQIREKIGVMYGNPETTPGGRAIKHATSLRIEVKKTGWFPNERERKSAKGQWVSCRFNKNKIGVPLRTANFVLMHDGSIDKALATHALCKELALYSDKDMLKGHSWFWKGEKVAGKEADFIQYLRENADVLDELAEMLNSFEKGDTNECKEEKSKEGRELGEESEGEQNPS